MKNQWVDYLFSSDFSSMCDLMKKSNWKKHGRSINGPWNVTHHLLSVDEKFPTKTSYSFSMYLSVKNYMTSLTTVSTCTCTGQHFRPRTILSLSKHPSNRRSSGKGVVVHLHWRDQNRHHTNMVFVSVRLLQLPKTTIRLIRKFVQ